jgi:hypothetical protein
MYPSLFLQSSFNFFNRPIYIFITSLQYKGLLGQIEYIFTQYETNKTLFEIWGSHGNEMPILVVRVVTPCKEHTASIFRSQRLRSSDKLVSTPEFTRRYNPEDQHRQTGHCLHQAIGASSKVGTKNSSTAVKRPAHLEKSSNRPKNSHHISVQNLFIPNTHDGQPCSAPGRILTLNIQCVPSYLFAALSAQDYCLIPANSLSYFALFFRLVPLLLPCHRLWCLVSTST